MSEEKRCDSRFAIDHDHLTEFLSIILIYSSEKRKHGVFLYYGKTTGAILLIQF